MGNTIVELCQRENVDAWQINAVKLLGSFPRDFKVIDSSSWDILLKVAGLSYDSPKPKNSETIAVSDGVGHSRTKGQDGSQVRRTCL